MITDTTEIIKLLTTLTTKYAGEVELLDALKNPEDIRKGHILQGKIEMLMEILTEIRTK